MRKKRDNGKGKREVENEGEKENIPKTSSFEILNIRTKGLFLTSFNCYKMKKRRRKKTKKHTHTLVGSQYVTKHSNKGLLSTSFNCYKMKKKERTNYVFSFPSFFFQGETCTVCNQNSNN